MKKNKFSIVVPVYNTSKVLKRCLDSILSQSYDNFELIIVNDGSTDNSLDIIKEYKDKRIIIIDQKNGGLSDARNSGVKKASGDYLLFIDSDDSINKDLLDVLNDKITDEDLIRFQIRKIDKEETNYHEKEFNNLSGIEAFKILSTYHFVETAVCYAYKKDFYLNNNFKFTKGTYHEDFGLLPEVIIKAKNVTSIDYIGYNYYFTEGSITNDGNYNKVIKRANDMMIHYDRLINISNDAYYKSFISNSILIKSNTLKGNDKKEYLKQIKNKHIIDNLLSDNFKRKLKRTLLKKFPNIFIRGMR